MTDARGNTAASGGMEALQRFSLKIYADPPEAVAPRAVIPVFHRWIRERAVAELLIDVADYTHLVDGPQVLLVAHEANYAIDGSGGRTGLSYTRKQPAGGSLADRLSGAARALLAAGLRLEQDPEAMPDGRFAFRGDEIAVAANDRLLAPNTAEAAAALREPVAELAERLFGGGYAIEPLAASDRVGFSLKATAPASLDALLARLP